MGYVPDVMRKRVYDKDDNQVVDLAALPTIPKTKLEHSVTGTGANVNDLTFSKKIIYRRFRLADDRFTLHFDDFMIERFYYTSIQEGGPTLTRSYNNGIFRADYDSSGAEYYRIQSPYPYPVFGAIIKIPDISGATGMAHVQCGLISTDNANRIACVYDTDGNFKIEERVGGTNYTRASVTLSAAPKYMLFVVAAKWAMILHSSDGINWVYGTKAALSRDIRDDSTRNTLYPYWGGGANVSGAYYEVDYVRFFVPVGVGHRDVKPVTDIYGNPIYLNGKYYFTATTPVGTGDDSKPRIASSFLSVFSFNPVTYEIEPVGAIFTNRGGKTLCDHAGHLVYDPRDGKWMLLVSGWGDYDATSYCDIYKGTTYENLLYGVHVLPVTKLDLGITTSAYDPSLAIINDKYYLSCVVTSTRTAPWDFYTHLFESTDMTTWTDKSSYTPQSNEGATLSKVGDTWYVVSSKGTNTMVVLSFPDLTEVRTISVDTGHSHPWGGIFPMLKNGKTRYYLIVMDDETAVLGGTDLGSYTWGGLHIYESDQAYDGYEFGVLNYY